MSEPKSREVFTKLLKNWDMCAVDSIGKSRGFLSTWNPFKGSMIPYTCDETILLVGSLQD